MLRRRIDQANPDRRPSLSVRSAKEIERLAEPVGGCLVLTLIVGRLCECVALQRYRRQHDRWPDTLDALVPAFLAEVPVDPHDGKPLRYRRLTDGIVIYSIGPDKIDDGGKLDRVKVGTTGSDVGIQLWDPAKRRQPPPPPPKGTVAGEDEATGNDDK